LRPLLSSSSSSSVSALPRALHSFPTRRSSDLCVCSLPGPPVSTSGRRSRSIRSTRLTGPEPRRPAAAVDECVGSGLGDGIRLGRSEEHTSELQSRFDLVCRLLLEKKKRQEHSR